MTATDGLPPVCPRTGLVRTGTGCLHCVYSVKVADWWTCAFRFLGACESDVTPAQAVEATLGCGTCHMTLRDDMRGHAYQDVYECSECGEQVIRETYMGESEPPKFCPNCRREVVE